MTRRLNVLQKLSFSVLAAGALLPAPSAFSANDAFDTAPTATGGIANFTGNFTLGTTTPAAAGTGTPVTGDALYFGTSSTTTLNDDLTAGISFAGFTFNSGASAFTIGGNSFVLTGNVADNSTSLETINNAISETAVRTFTMTNGGGNITLGGVISGTSGGITTAGAGILTLSATGNSYTGATTIAAGTTLSLSGTLTGGAAVSVAGTGVLSETSTGGISGASSVALAGTGTSSLAGTNSYTGVTTIGIGTTLNLSGSLTGATAITNSGTFTESGAGVIGSAAATLTNTLGTTTLSGLNTYTGATSVNGGTLALDFSAATSPTAATNIINTGNTINLGGGTLSIKGGGAGATNSQTFGTTNLTANTSSAITLNSNGGTALNLALGGITRNAQSTFDITLPAAGTVTTTLAQAPSNGILVNSNSVAYGTANGGTTWLAKATGTSPFALTAYTGYSTGTANYISTNNVDVANGDSVSGVTVNTLRFNAATDALTLAGTNIVSTGGILVTPAATAASITGGTLEGGTTGKELVVIDYGAINIGSVIANNTSASLLTLSGPGTTTLSGANTYTGATSINGGTVILGVSQNGTTSGALGTGSGALSMALGSTLNLAGNNVSVGAFTPTSSATTNATIANSGTAATITTGNANLTGVTVTGPTTVNVTGTTLTLPGVAVFSGSTGALELTGNSGRQNNIATALGSATLILNGDTSFQTTSNQTIAGNVVVNGTTSAWNYQATTQINGSLTGSGKLTINNGFNPNFTFAGDTTAFAGTLVLQGSGYAGYLFSGTNTGSALASFDLQASNATGNPTLAYAGVGNRTVALGDLNTTGSTNTGGTTNIVVQNNTASTTATFQVGALGATSTYAGTIVNGTGTSALTKVGIGTLTLSGVNTYTGATSITGGVLNLAATKTISATSGITIGGAGQLSLAAASALATPGVTTSTTAGSPVSVAGQVPISLGGGTLLRNGTGTSLGSQAGTAGTVGVGMLTLTAASTLDFGATGVGTLNFNSFTDAGNFLLTVVNYTSAYSSTTTAGAGLDNTDDRLIFNQNMSGLLSDFSINGQTPTQLALGNGEFELVAAVPEPSTWIMSLVMLGVFSFSLRRRLAEMSAVNKAL